MITLIRYVFDPHEYCFIFLVKHSKIALGSPLLNIFMFLSLKVKTLFVGNLVCFEFDCLYLKLGVSEFYMK